VGLIEGPEAVAPVDEGVLRRMRFLNAHKSWAILPVAGVMLTVLAVLAVRAQGSSTSAATVDFSAPLLSGIVVDANGVPKPGVVVRVAVERREETFAEEVPVATDTTDELGAFNTSGELPLSITDRNPDGSVNLWIALSDQTLDSYYNLMMMPPEAGADFWSWPDFADLGVVAPAERDGLSPGDAADNLQLVFAPDSGMASEWTSSNTISAPDALTSDAK